MSVFTGNLVTHLATSLDVDVSDVEKALDSFTGAKTIEKKKIPSLEKATVLDTSKPKKTDETHPCERVKKGKTDPCGKNSTHYIVVEGVNHYYCGNTTGCYPIEMKARAKTELQAVKEEKSKETKKKTSVPVENQSPISLINKIVQSKKLDCVPKQLSTGETVFMEKTTRALFDKNTQECYGILGDDNTILPVNDKITRWVESQGLIIKSNVKSTPHIKRETQEKTLELTSSEEELALSDESS